MKDAMLVMLTASVWQIPLIALVAWTACGCLRSWPAVWQVWIWRFASTGALALPLATALLDVPVLPGFRLLASNVAPATAALIAPARPAATDLLWVAYLAATCFFSTRLLMRMLALRRLNEQNIRVPMTFGFFAPKILFPQRFNAEASHTAKATAWAHEEMHLRHHDFAWNLALETLSLPLAFHPAQHWILAQTRASVEMHCDEQAALSIGDRTTYAKGLLEAAELLGSQTQVPLVSTLFDQNILEKRVENLMLSKSNPTPLPRWMAIAILSAGMSLAAFASLQLGRAAQEEPVYSIQDKGMVAPKVLQRKEPQYSQAAREKNISGTVVLSVVITSAGQATQAKVLRSLEESLDQNAIEAVKTWRFQPATKDGEPVAIRATIEVNFRRN